MEHKIWDKDIIVMYSGSATRHIQQVDSQQFVKCVSKSVVDSELIDPEGSA